MLQENFISTLEHSFRDNWELEACTDYGKGRTLKYSDVVKEVEKIHLLFERCGIQKGDKIALMGRNNSNWVVVYIATITYGAVIVPILQDFKANDALHIINHSGSRMFFVTDRLWEGFDIYQMEEVLVVISLKTLEVLSQRDGVVVPTVADRVEAFAQKFPNGMTSSDVKYDHRENSEIASISYTSGTSGFSKGVVLSLNSLMGNVKFCRGEHAIYRGSRQLVFLPLAHAFGCAFDFLTSFCVGAHCFFIGRTPSPKVLLDAFKEVKPNFIFIVPLILEKIYKKQIQPILGKSYIHWIMKIPFMDDLILGKIKKSLDEAFGELFAEVVIGGAPLNEEVDEFLHRIKFRYTVGYGMTECGPLISFTHWNDYVPHSCGKALPGLMEVRIDDPNEEGIGEIVVRGENVMEGYYKDEEDNKKIFTADGWLRTGDLGTIDEKGNIFIRGRIKSMLLGASGQNIYPEEIESKLNNMPYVMESLVINNGETLEALIYPNFEMVDADHLTNAQLEAAMEENRKEVNKQLPMYEQIKSVRLYPHEFEKTPKKSIKRFLYTK